MVGRRDAIGVAARRVRIAARVRTLAAAEEPEVRVRRAVAHHRVQRRAAHELDDRRRRSSRPASRVLRDGIGEADDRRQDDAVRRVEVADAVLGVEVVHVLRSRGPRLVGAVLTELVVLQPAPRVAVAAAPPARLRRLSSTSVTAWYWRLPPSVRSNMFTSPNCGNGRRSCPSGTVARVPSSPACAMPKNGLAHRLSQRRGVPAAARRREQLPRQLGIDLVDVEPDVIGAGEPEIAPGRSHVADGHRHVAGELALHVERVLVHDGRAFVLVDEVDVAADAGEQAQRAADRLLQSARERVVQRRDAAHRSPPPTG